MGRLELRINGIHSAWMAEFGHDCPHCNELRAADPYRMANVSYSLIQRGDDGALERHTLVDIGLGVMQSLLDFEHAHDVHVIHEVLLSHSHFDHVGQLDWLGQAVRRNGRAEQPRPVPVHCTQPCWEIGPSRLFPWLLKDVIRHEPIAAGRAFQLGALRVTPMAVEHGNTAPGAVGFCLEWSGGSGPRKIILTCDFLRIVDRHDPLWRDADVIFIESNCWNPNPDTGHQCIREGLELLRLWQPRRAYLIHYSGHEDARHQQAAVNGPMTYPDLAKLAQQQAGPLDVRIARHGMVLPLDEPWP